MSQAISNDIYEQDVVQVSTNQTSCDLEGEIIILNLKDSMYYRLDGVGARVWTLVREPISVRRLIDILLEEYDVTLEVCSRELRELLRDLSLRELIEIKHASLGQIDESVP